MCNRARSAIAVLGARTLPFLTLIHCGATYALDVSCYNDQISTGQSANAINNNGVVAGGYVCCRPNIMAYIFYPPPDGTTIQLGTLCDDDDPYEGNCIIGCDSAAFDINDSGIVVGWSRVDTPPCNRHAFSKQGSFMTDLGTLEGVEDAEGNPIELDSVAQAVNNSGTIVGWSETWAYDGQGNRITGPVKAFQSSGGGMSALPCADTDCVAHDINDLGEIVGGADGRAYVWSPIHGNQYLGELAAGGGSFASGINNQGLIVGSASEGATLYRKPVIWEWDGGLGRYRIQRLPGPVYADSQYPQATQINDAGQIVGFGYTGAGGPGTLWEVRKDTQGNVLRDAQGDILFSYAGLGIVSGWPTDINDAGQIVGYHTSSLNGFLMTPPEVQLTSIDDKLLPNKRRHHTERFILINRPRLALRRGDTIQVSVKVSQEFDPSCHDVLFEAALQNSPGASPILIPQVDVLQAGEWGAKRERVASQFFGGKTVDMTINLPPQAAVGEYVFKAGVYLKGATYPLSDLVSFPRPIVILFNAWNPLDDAYIATEMERAEYVLNTEGMLWKGKWNNFELKRWNFAQFDETVLNVAIDLLSSSNVSTMERASPFLVAKKITEAVPVRVLKGKWEQPYLPNMPPGWWGGSAAIIGSYAANPSEQVKYVQCWEFGGTLTSLLRTLGIPTRPITTYECGEDNDGDKDVEFVTDENGTRDPDDDDRWNFHVWCEIWTKRSVAGQEEYDGWQAVDATYGKGPAPVLAVKRTTATSNPEDAEGHPISFDVPWHYAEVDAIMKVRYNPSGFQGDPCNPDGTCPSPFDCGADNTCQFGPSQTSVNECDYLIGHRISTKALGYESRVDVTPFYKTPESTLPDQCGIIGDRGAPPSNIEVVFGLPHETDLGSDVIWSVSLNNTGQASQSCRVLLKLSAVSYRGTVVGAIDQTDITTTLNPGEPQTFDLIVPASLYTAWTNDTRTLEAYGLVDVESGMEVFATMRRTQLVIPGLALTLTPPDGLLLNESVTCEASWTNPLSADLHNLRVKYAVAQGLTLSGSSEVEIPVGTVNPGQTVIVSENVTAIAVGSHSVNVILMADELSGVEGSALVNVIGFVDIGSLPGGADGFGRAVNNTGQVVGDSALMSGDRHAFLWENAQLTDLGTLGGADSFAHDVNDSGVIVGASANSSGFLRAFVHSNGMMTDLGTLGGDDSAAFGVNEDGQVVGEAATAGGPAHAFVWQEGQMTDLGALPGGSISSARDINELGQVVGQAETAGGLRHAFIMSDNEMTDLGTLGGDNSIAHGINDAGQVVGQADTPGGVSRAFLWQNGAMSDLGTLGGSASTALDINSLGEVVGYADTTADGPHAFLWKNGVLLDLNAVLPPGSGWILRQADGINDLGWITGHGTNPGGQTHAFLLIPPPSDSDGDWDPDGADNCTDLPNPDQSDADSDGVGDLCDVCPGFDDRLDCNSNGIPDGCESMTDCNSNGVQDICDLAGGTSADCNGNGTPDECDLASGASGDCNANGTPDECESTADCNTNGVLDLCDLIAGTSADCNLNGTPDECELHTTAGFYAVEWDSPALYRVDATTGSTTLVAAMSGSVVRGLGLAAHPLTGELYVVTRDDVNQRSLATLNPATAALNVIGSLAEPLSDIAFHPDGRLYGVLSNSSSRPGHVVLVDPSDASITPTGIILGGGAGQSLAFRPGNGLLYHAVGAGANRVILRTVNVDTGQVAVVNADVAAEPFNALAFEAFGGAFLGFGSAKFYTIDPDTGAATLVLSGGIMVTGLADLARNGDCNGNAAPDDCDLAMGTSADCDSDAVPDECERDCNGNGAPDSCDIASAASADENGNGLPDECERDCNGNGRPDDLDVLMGSSADCDNDSVPDECGPDCNANGILDGCEVVAGTAPDCNANGAPDECDITDGTSTDCDGNGVPDSCDLAQGSAEDCNSNGLADACEDCDANGFADECDLTPGPVTFDVAVFRPVGTQPNTVAVVDLDGDADRDLVVANEASNTVSVLINMGGGVFAPAVNYPAGNIPRGMIAADLDRDDDMDIVVGNTSPSAVSVLLNDGNGVLAAPVTYTVSSTVKALAAADVDGDGWVDLAACGGGSLVLLLRNTGNANYTFWVNLFGANFPDSITTADFNGDDRPDFAATSQTSALVFVWLNMGNWSFSSAVSFSGGGGQIARITAGDLNGDANADLVTANYTTDDVSVLLGDGTGAFALAGTVAVGDTPVSVTIGDWNGDLLPDLATANYNSNDTSLLVNAGGGMFNAAATLTGANRPNWMASGDLDGDGDLDLASANWGADNASAWINRTVRPQSVDCNRNGVPDECDLAAGGVDCNANGTLDECELLDDPDCNANGVLDECDPDCNANAIPDACDIASGASADCNLNGIPDTCDIAGGASADCNADGTPDECEPDCNANMVADDCDIAQGFSEDCNANGVPDECDGADCNANGVLDECDLAAQTSADCDGNLTPDECDIASGAPDCNANGVIDGCEVSLSLLGVTPNWVGPYLYRVDPDTGAQTLVGTLDQNVEGATGLARHPLNGALYAVVTIGPTRPLATIDPDTAAVTFIGDPGTYLSDIAFRGNGVLYGIAGNNSPAPGEIFIVSAADGSLTSTGIVRGSGWGQSIAFQPGTGLLYHQYAVDGCNVALLEKIDVDTGVVTPIIESETFCELNSMVFHPTGSPLLGQEFGWLLSIDPATGEAMFLGHGPETLTGLVAITSPFDLNFNGVPDDCEDCNMNGQPDELDIAGGASQDLNGNGVPDECEACRDLDGDGDGDEADLLVLLAASGACQGEYGYDPDADIDADGCVDDADYLAWLQCYRYAAGDPMAAPPAGVLGDFDGDGDLDLRDFAAYQRCMPAEPETSLLCGLKFDFDHDEDVDLADFAAWNESFTGP